MSTLRMLPAEEVLLEARGYQIGKSIFYSGPTVVYRGTCKGKPIAVKQLSMHSFTCKDIAMEVLLRKLITHPNVVQYLDLAYLLSSTSLLIFMEYMAGGDLEAYLDYLGRRKTPMTESAIAALFRQIVEALTYMHTHGYAHRDIKSENILLDESHKVAKISSFGIGFIDTDSSQTMVNEGRWRGSSAYLPPEILESMIADRHGGGSSSMGDPLGGRFSPFKGDVWSMGVLLYEMLHQGGYPFAWVSISEREMYALQHEELSFDEHISPMAQGVYKKLLIYEPKDRPQIGDILKDEWFTWAEKQEPPEEIPKPPKIQEFPEIQKVLEIQKVPEIRKVPECTPTSYLKSACSIS